MSSSQPAVPDHAIKLIVGLGNPGSEYAYTRHNVGTWLVEMLASQSEHAFRSEPKLMGQTCLILLDHHPCRVFVPATFMNNSGQAVRTFAHFYKIEPENILVVHDELDLPPGAIRLKKGGGHGGHNGLRDIISQLGTPDFHRLRIGIGHPGSKDEVTPFVLGRPSRPEQDAVLSAISDGIAILPRAVGGDISGAMQQLHTNSPDDI
jgi:peptidyl-tRNA hydrolase, PTH1 family